MRDADLKREYHRLCRKRPGTLVDTEACFRAFKAGVEYSAIERTAEDLLAEAMMTQAQREEWEG